MFKPATMSYISLNLLIEDVPLMAQLLAEYGLFNPELPVIKELSDNVNSEFRTIFNNAHSRLDKILAKIPDFKPMKIIQQNVELSALQVINQQLGDIWEQFSKLEEELHQLREQEKQLHPLVDTLRIFSELDINLRLLQQPRQFLNLHIGIIQTDNLAHFEESILLANHFTHVFHRTGESVYVIVAGHLAQQKQINSILEHADFHALHIPPQFQDYPQQVHADLTQQLNEIKQQIHTLQLHQQQLAQLFRPQLQRAYQLLNSAVSYAELTNTLKSKGQIAVIEGWTPQADLPRLEKMLAQFHRPVILNARTPELAEYQQVPSLMRHHRLLAAFTSLVKNYGIPRYGEFDPTLLFAITFLLMFGMMFGDVGHGLVIMAAGAYWRKKLQNFTPFFIFAGLASIFFGFLYGSFFGFEETPIPALWMSPLHDPFLMLTAALYWGVGFILIATVITIVNRWREGHYLTACFDNKGIAGILLYLGGFYAIQQWMATGQFDTQQQLMVFIPLLAILGYKWHENKIPFGERLLVTAIEGFESILNYLANTLSFLRVAAFSLNHVALAIAVFTLANMLGDIGSIIMIILGNLFIIVLEGAIVTIQVLRLQYYEGFSRFFSGDGKEFRVLRAGLE